MKTTIIAIGNSRGIRIPKPILAESGLEDEVELKVRRGEIRITKISKKVKSKIDTLLLSEKALSDWEKPQEDEAWESLQ